MGVAASLTLPTGDAVTSVDEFLYVFATVYTLVIFAYILTSWLRLPYSPTLNRIQRFLYDVCEPYLRLFRRVLPSMGALERDHGTHTGREQTHAAAADDVGRLSP
jgi:YggT family protein